MDPHDKHIAALLESTATDIAESVKDALSFLPSIVGGLNMENAAHQTYQTEGLQNALTTPLDVDMNPLMINAGADISGEASVMQDNQKSTAKMSFMNIPSDGKT